MLLRSEAKKIGQSKYAEQYTVRNSALFDPPSQRSFMWHPTRNNIALRVEDSPLITCANTSKPALLDSECTFRPLFTI